MMNDIEFEAVVLAAGEYPTAPQPLKVLHDAPCVVCCDGAADNYIATGHVPHAIVGDGDSISPANREKYTHILHCIAEQESNDQTKAVRHLLAQGKRRIAIVGATGCREDHTLGNISLLIEYMRAGAQVRSFTNHGVFIPCCGTVTLPCVKGQQVSIFAITARKMSATGLLYPIYDFTNWWQGTLNECTGESFTVNAQGEYLLFINY